MIKPCFVLDIFPRDYLLEDKWFIIEMYEVRRYEFCSGISLGEIDFDETFIKMNEDLGLVTDETPYLTLGIDTSNFLFTEPTYMPEDIFPLKETKFENYTFKVPNNPDGILKRLYGNYMRILSSIEYYDNLINLLRINLILKKKCIKLLSMLLIL